MDSGLADTTSFANNVRTLLQEGSTVQTLNIFTDNKNSAEIIQNSWDLIPIIANHLSEESENNNVEVFKCCEKLIDIVAEQSKPEEALLQFIEEIEAATDDTKFLMLVRPLQKVLLRVPEKRLTSLTWCFNSIQSYLNKLETPEDLNLTDEEKLLMDSNPIVDRITFLYSELLEFSQVFINELLEVEVKSSNFSDRIHIIRKSLVQLLGKPLAFLDMEIYNHTKPKARRIAENLIAQICTVTPDPFLFLELRDGTHNSDLMKPNDLSLAVFYYLILSEDGCVKYTPKVYNPIYIFHSCLHLVNELLTQDNQFVLRKGISFINALLKNVDRLELPYLLLDGEKQSSFCKTLANIVVHNDSKSVRKMGLQVMHDYLWAFDHQGRYNLIYHLMRCVNHSGLKGYIITQYKEMFRQAMTTTKTWEDMPKYYYGRKLFDLLEEFTFLKQKEETDLVDESDQIVSTLNFIRYLVIADTTGNYSCIDFYLDILKERYFAHLQKGIMMSKAHYNLKLKKLNEADGKGDDEEPDCEVSAVVSGKKLLELPNHKKIEIMNLSLTTLDVIESLLTRVITCIEDRRAPYQNDY